MRKVKSDDANVAQGHDIREAKRKRLEKTQPGQLSMFQTFLPPEDKDKYSNTIELYDAIPKYFTNKSQIAKLRNGPYLPSLQREFRHRDITYMLKITPARVEDEAGNDLEYYPSEQEELLEEALRKIACDRLNGVFLDDEAGVQFTMYELRDELRKMGHTMSLRQLKLSLSICNGTKIILEKKGDDGKSEMMSYIFPTVMISSREDWTKAPKKTYCYVQFNPLVTKSIKELSYRQLDYQTLMGYRYQLSRWLHRRLYHNYRQADLLGSPYTIKFSTIKRDSALLNNNRTTKDIEYLERSFDELKKKNVIMDFEKKIRRGQHNKIDDVLYEIRPGINFTGEMKKANKRAADQIAYSPINLPAHDGKIYSLPEKPKQGGERKSTRGGPAWNTA